MPFFFILQYDECRKILSILTVCGSLMQIKSRLIVNVDIRVNIDDRV